MRLPENNHLVRTCSATKVDEQKKPTIAAFFFRFDGDNWKDTDLSVHWLDFCQKDEEAKGGGVEEKLNAFRRVYAENSAKEESLRVPMMQIKKSHVFAVLNVRDIEAETIKCEGSEAEINLICQHQPQAGFEDVDPHSGITPTPGVDTWPKDADALNAPEHLAVAQYLLLRVCHDEVVGE